VGPRADLDPTSSQSLYRLSYPGRPILASLCVRLDSRNITLYSSTVNALSDLFIMRIDPRLVLYL
jgi:hypothetical protein